MISEPELEALSFPGAPKIVSAVLPGPTSATLLEEAPNYRLLHYIPVGANTSQNQGSVEPSDT